MLNLKKVLAADILEGIHAAGIEIPDGFTVVVEHADNLEHGDYASPVALGLAKHAKVNPMEALEKIAAGMPKKEYLAELQAVAPGFLNIWISEEWLASKVDDVVEEDVCSDVSIGGGKLVNLEFISANPTGPLTLGNARTAFSADTLGNVLECAGYNVTREYYINDAGAQIRRLGESVLRRILLQRGVEVEFPEDLYQGEYVEQIASRVAENLEENEGKEFSVTDLDDADLLDVVSREAMEMCLAMIKTTIHDDLQIHFDVWSSERAVRKSGMIERSLQTLREKGLTYKKEGAEYLKTTEFGDDEDRVLVKQDGEYAYIAPDIGYHQDKFDRKFDLIFTFLGADHLGHVPKLKGALAMLGNDVNRLRFPVAQMMALTRKGEQVKLSKRAGQVYSPADLIKEIGYDATRFFMVQHNLSSHMDLDLDLAAERSERNPVYYVQYAYVRLQSILRKAKEQGVIQDIEGGGETDQKATLMDTSEFALVKKMFELPEVIVQVAESYEVHRLAYYAHALAKDIHWFYNNVPVLTEESKELQYSRIQLVRAARKVMGQTLDLLGISKPDVM